MFSQLSSERFEKDKEAAPGPGAYDLPSTLDPRAAGMDGPDRWNENPEDPSSVADGAEARPEEKPVSQPVPANCRSGEEKENRAPSVQRKRPCGVRNQSPRQAASETSNETKELHQVQRVKAQLGTTQEEFKQKMRELKEMQQQLIAKDRKMEDLQRKFDDITADRRDAHRRVSEAEAQRDAMRKQMREKDLEITSVKKKEERLRTTLEERGRQLERTEAISTEIQKLKASNEVLQGRLDVTERDRKSLDEKVRLQENQKKEMEQTCNKQLQLLQDSLAREEERISNIEHQAEHRTHDYIAEHQHATQLQQTLIQCEAEVLAETKQRMLAQSEELKCADLCQQEREKQLNCKQEADEEIQQLRRTNDMLQTRVDTAEKERQSLGDQLLEHTRTKEQCEQDGQEQVRSLQSSLADKETQLHNIQCEAKQSNDDLAAARHRVSELKDKVIKCEDEVREAAKERMAVQAEELKCASLYQQELKGYSKRVEEFVMERAKAADQEAERQRAADAKCKTMASKIDDAEGRAVALGQDLKEERKRSSEIADEHAKLESEMAICQARVQEQLEKEEKQQEEGAEAAQFRETAKALEEHLHATESECQALHGELDSHMQHKLEMEQSCQKEIQTYQNSLTHKDELLRNLHQQVEQGVANLDEEQQRATALAEAVAQSKAEALAACHAEIATREEIKLFTQEYQQELAASVAKAEAQNVAHLDELAAASRAAMNFTSELQMAKEAQSAELSSLAAQADIHAQELGNNLVEERSRSQGLEHQNAELEHELSMLKQRIAELHQEQEGKHEELQGAALDIQRLTASTEALQGRLDTSEDERKTLENNMKAREQEKQQMEKNCTEQVRTLQEALSQREAQHVELGSEVEEHLKELNKKQQQVDQLEQSINECETKLKVEQELQIQKREEYQKLEGDLATAHAKIKAQSHELQCTEQRQQEVQAHLARATDAKEEHKSELCIERQRSLNLEDQGQKAEARCTELSSQLEKADTRALALEANLADTKGQLAQLESKSNLLEGEMISYQRRIAELEDELQEKPKLLARVEHAEKEAVDAAGEIQRMKNQIEEFAERERHSAAQHLDEVQGAQEKFQLQAQEMQLVAEEEKKVFQLKIQDLGKIRVQLEEQGCKLSEQVRQVDEKCAVLEARAVSAEAGTADAANKLEQERKEFEAQIKALHVQHDTAMAVKGEEHEVSLLAERDLHAKREEELQDKLNEARRRAVHNAWRLLLQIERRKDLEAQIEDNLAAVRTVALQWRTRAVGHESDEPRLQRQDAELNRLEEELQALIGEKQEMVLSLQQLQRELQISQAENKHLRDREAAYEEDVLRISERSAELGGHSNHKQKIKHLQAVKEENQSLRQDLKRCQQHASHLEAQLRTANFFDACAPEAGTKCARTTGSKLQSTTPRCVSKTPSRDKPGARDLFRASSPDMRQESRQRDRAEAARAAKVQQRAVERASSEYQHLALLIEHALSGAPDSTCSGTRSSTLYCASSDTCDTVPTNAVTVDTQIMLQRLRDLAAGISSGNLNQHITKRRGSEYDASTPQTRPMSMTPSPAKGEVLMTPERRRCCDPDSMP